MYMLFIEWMDASESVHIPTVPFTSVIVLSAIRMPYSSPEWTLQWVESRCLDMVESDVVAEQLVPFSLFEASVYRMLSNCTELINSKKA